MLALVSAVLLLAPALAAQKTDSAQALLRAATDKAVVDGDLNGAIKQYQTIVDTFKTDRAVVATALVRMAECYQKLGDAESRKIYERVAREFADQAESAATARTRLAALASASLSAARQVWSRW
jgi:lipopolysaccharide biosynthesis regulator YciM